MKTLSLILTSVMMVASSAMADSHGGVVAANKQMDAVATYASNSGGDLYRALKIEKQNGSDLFKISYGGMNSMTGKESVEGQETVKATVTYSTVDGTINVNVKHVSGLDLSN